MGEIVSEGTGACGDLAKEAKEGFVIESRKGVSLFGFKLSGAGTLPALKVGPVKLSKKGVSEAILFLLF
jgi:hypothetical protein